MLRPTGAVTRWWNGVQERVAEGLPSHAIVDAPPVPPLVDGSVANGPNGISFQGTGGAFITLGLGGGPAFLEDLRNEFFFGTLIHMSASGEFNLVANVALYEFDHNPAGDFLDSNPFSVLAEPGGRVIADAGGNSLIRV